MIDIAITRYLPVMIRTRRRNLPNPALRNLIGLDAQLVTLIGSNG
jgi:hypothetical protein